MRGAIVVGILIDIYDWVLIRAPDKFLRTNRRDQSIAFYSIWWAVSVFLGVEEEPERLLPCIDRALKKMVKIVKEKGGYEGEVESILEQWQLLVEQEKRKRRTVNQWQQVLPVEDNDDYEEEEE